MLFIYFNNWFYAKEGIYEKSIFNRRMAQGFFSNFKNQLAGVGFRFCGYDCYPLWNILFFLRANFYSRSRYNQGSEQLGKISFRNCWSRGFLLNRNDFIFKFSRPFLDS